MQLYTVRDQTEKDFLGTIRKVAEMGYQAVEFAGYYNTPAAEIKALLDELQLQAPSAHVGLNFGEPANMAADLAKQIKTAKMVGVAYLIVPWAPLPETPTAEDVKHLAGMLEQAGKLAAQAGLRLGYHNHDFEFKLVDDQPILDHLLSTVPAEFLVAEFDLGWMHLAGYKVSDYVKKYAGRVPLAHFKDFDKGRKDVVIGQGIVDLKSVLPIAEQAGIEYLFVEQEEFENASSLDSAKAALEFFRANGML
ncbi:sugar phosphate isomerase/epimerase family protein [Paenibacillus methanolicus]|uniref:Sugar phosphate isomerase/epimerase n=1 Tax=Paenibacillus methanolicus TaxID=582686 RepID=A0A5S5BUB4_9BACL|nr:sugar phosphate isomerase/epimerase [Paenibacillus methanolicus]TYP69183.1 sugar phosphate isomerase/epimerase [Paenibacillus methanolicus]